MRPRPAPRSVSNAKGKRPSSSAGAKANITGGAYDPTDIYSSQAYDLNALYNQGHCCNPLGNSGVTPPSSSIAIATAGTQSGSDFAGFQAQYPYLAYHYQQFYIDGTPTCCDGEGTEDFDWSTAWSNSFGSYVDTSMIYLYDGVNNSFSTFTDVYNAIYTGGKANGLHNELGVRRDGLHTEFGDGYRPRHLQLHGWDRNDADGGIGRPGRHGWLRGRCRRSISGL
jgi:hypothetical protein